MSKIEWTDVTDNVFVVRGADGKPHGHYCEKVSPGCTNCYAEKFNNNPFFGGNKLKYQQTKQGAPPIMIRRDIMDKWKRQRKPKRHFINSMTDTFADFIPTEYMVDLLDAMNEAPKQTFQILTKRAGIMLMVVKAWLESKGLERVPDNIWLGVSAENNRWLKARTYYLKQIPCKTKYISIEPLLESLDYDYLRKYLSHYQWVIVGGESGDGARPIHPDWVRDIRDQCASLEIPFFFKQWGAWFPASVQFDDNGKVFILGELEKHDFALKDKHLAKENTHLWLDDNGILSDPRQLVSFRIGKKNAGRMLDGQTWDQFPEVDHVA